MLPVYITAVYQSMTPLALSLSRSDRMRRYICGINYIEIDNKTVIHNPKLCSIRHQSSTSKESNR
jgi:hypothetical protein